MIRLSRLIPRSKCILESEDVCVCVCRDREMDSFTAMCLFHVLSPSSPLVHSLRENSFSPLYDSLSNMKGTYMGYPPLRLHQHEKP